MLTLEQKDFLRLVDFVQKNYGINLIKKKQLIEGRLSTTVISMKYTGFAEYIDYIITKSNKTDIETMLNKLTTNYTFFMREKVHFDFFREQILSNLVRTKKDRVLSIWSAGCSSGEEPYTISMILKDFFGKDAPLWDTRILATDISQKALSKAKEGKYELQALEDIPKKWLDTYFKAIPNTSQYEVVPQIKSNVIFKTFNLMEPVRFKLQFDVIFCRNVMIYFDASTKNALVNRFYESTNRGGYLMIGHSETLNKDTTNYKYVMSATYSKP